MIFCPCARGSGSTTGTASSIGPSWWDGGDQDDHHGDEVQDDHIDKVQDDYGDGDQDDHVVKVLTDRPGEAHDCLVQ